MKHPLWIVNSALIGFVIAAFAFFMIFKQEIPDRESISPKKRKKVSKIVSKIDPKKIYENDLFDTYRKEILTPKETAIVTPAPEPPSVIPVEVPVQPKPQFFDPLQITLKGIMATSDDSNNVAIVSDNKTTRDALYHVGDKVEDAQLIRIFKNKAIFLRSNGQQEVFYLRPKDAQEDPTFTRISNWANAIKKIDQNEYQIDPDAFAERVTNLGQFIDFLDLTTVYQQGKGVGVRIGESDIDLFSQSLGLQVGDMILDIADIPASSTKNRVKIYEYITGLHVDDSFKVTIQRNNQRFVIMYTFREFTEPKKVRKTPPPGIVSDFGLTDEQRKILEHRHSFAPTIQEIKQQERRNMQQHGRSSAGSNAQQKLNEK